MYNTRSIVNTRSIIIIKKNSENRTRSIIRNIPRNRRATQYKDDEASCGFDNRGVAGVSSGVAGVSLAVPVVRNLRRSLLCRWGDSKENSRGEGEEEGIFYHRDVPVVI